MICKNCGIGFIPKSINVAGYCSRRCVSIVAGQVTKEKYAKYYTCEVCGVSFQTRPASANRCCSRKCGFDLQRMERANAKQFRLNTVAPKPSPERRCVCGAILAKKRQFCDVCLAAHTAVNNKHQNDKRLHPRAPEEKRCETCGKAFHTVSSMARFCSFACNKAEAMRTRKARMRLGYHAPRISFAAVWDASGGRCHICGERCSRSFPNNHPLRATIDHVFPLALHGKHDLGNLRLAHMVCNSVKCDAAIVTDVIREEAKRLYSKWTM